MIRNSITDTMPSSEMVLDLVKDSEDEDYIQDDDEDSEFTYKEIPNQTSTQQSNISSLTSLGSTNPQTLKKKPGRPFGLKTNTNMESETEEQDREEDQT